MKIRPGSSWPFPHASLRASAAFLILACCWLVATAGAAYAQTPDTDYDESEAQAIDRMLMCPVCPAESIDQAQVPLARQMRQRVREMLTAGAGRQEILAYFADRYGQDVLASPPKSGVNLLAWILPIVGVVAALAVGLLVIRAMTSNNGDGGNRDGGGEANPEADLEPYLAVVDRSLVLPDQSNQSGAADKDVKDD